MTSQITVVNKCRDEYDVCIGRGSIWGNPFRLANTQDDVERAKVIEQYEQYLLSQPALMAQLPTLLGKRLGCFCAPKPCHGNVLKKHAELQQGSAAVITRRTGNLLDDDAQALINPVNTAAVMGKGLALAFKQRHPQAFTEYRSACSSGAVKPGRMHVVDLGALAPNRYVINFPTKRHWRDPSRLGDIRLGLDHLVSVIGALEISSIAVPPLGCGLGGLDWAVVEPMITSALAPIEGLEVRIYSPTN
jgi:O-acetyl-ADP-ribose deacetylase (regulator of RNase III)